MVRKTAKKYTAVPPAASATKRKAATKPVIVETPVEQPHAASVVAAPVSEIAPIAETATVSETAPVAALPDIEPLVLDLQSPIALVRGDAAIKLGESGNPEAAPALIDALFDSDADVAREAAAALGVLRQSSAVEPLIRVLSNREGYFHGVVRAAAASSLARLGDSRAVEPLLAAIHDPMAEASAEAVRALADLADPRAVQAIIDVVRNDDGFFLSIVRRAAVLALAKFGGEPGRNELRAVAADDYEDSVIREDARQALQ